MTESLSNSEQEEVKTFKDLDKEVIQKDLCCACGACVAYCESQSFDVIKLDEYIPKFKSKKNEDNCTECGLCYYICPQTDTLEELLVENLEIQDELGHIIDIIAAKTTREAINKVGQDGGIVTTILSYLFEKNKIDAAVVSEYDEELHPKPKLIFDKEELLKSAGTRYSISSQVLPLKDLYNIPLQIQKEKGIYDIDQIRVAFVGTPCQVKALRKMKLLSIKPAHVVKYIISLFCFENFEYSTLYELIRKDKGIKPSDIKKTYIKKNFFVESEKGDTLEVNIKNLDPAVRSHCKVCDDFAGRFSDISVGSTGAPENYSIIITRTEPGQKLIETLLSQKYIDQYIPPRDKETDWREKRKNFFRKMISRKSK
ncbi:MAG: Coenzyme F420 hydrogenase/dehydrogenase, beta subunit C-terminal domain [Promethearchaeati archaeon]